MGNQQQSLFEGTKVCRICEKEKSIKEFGMYNSRGTTYRRNSCLGCDRQWHKDRRGKDIEADRKRRRDQARRYRNKHRETYNAANRKFKRLHRERNKKLIYEAYGNKCACCGESNPKFFTIDHVNNDGHIERKNKYGSGTEFYRRIIKANFPDHYQVLCFNCNLGRARNGGICPHQECSTTIPNGSTLKRVEAPTTSMRLRDSLICMETCSGLKRRGMRNEHV